MCSEQSDKTRPAEEGVSALGQLVQEANLLLSDCLELEILLVISD